MAKAKNTTHQRFWQRVVKSDHCWLWTGSRQPAGYGLLSRDGKYVLTHRFSYELHYGPIPDGLWCLHHCDTPACVRPDHLFLGTHRENMLDSGAKGRNGAQRDPLGFSQRLQASLHLHPERRARGERINTAKLTAAQVREIRQTHARGNISYAALARAFGITPQNTRDIVLRHTWRHLED